jgi:hypothetical protein
MRTTVIHKFIKCEGCKGRDEDTKSYSKNEDLI